ncbi:MAG TPA: hypothetical protein VH914_03435 [Acidimicrobiia bacterium]|jgi:hypothetical protein|nr:hypothetical protein [Acidimicrobiia bacterium]
MPEPGVAEVVEVADVATELWASPPSATDALYDLRTAPALPLVCGRCGRVLEWVAVDLPNGRVFFRERVPRRGRGPSVRLRDYVDAEGHVCARLTYRCDHQCRMTYCIDFDAMQDACLAAARAGHALVALDIQ